MLSAFKIYFKNAFFSFRTAMVIIVIPLILFAFGLGDIISEFELDMSFAMQKYLQYACGRFSGKEMPFIIPIACTIPYAASFTEDIKSGFIKAILSRTKRTSYLVSKIFACIISGGLAVAVGMILFTLISLYVFLPRTDFTFIAADYIAAFIELNKKILCCFFSSGLWAGLGMLLSELSNNIAVAYLSPFTAFYLLEILYEKYFTDAKILSPISWINPGEGWPLGEVGVFVIVGELTVLIVMVFLLTAYAKIENV